MIGPEDVLYTYEYDGYYKILPMIYNFHLDKQKLKRQTCRIDFLSE